MKIEKNYGSLCSYLDCLQLVFQVGYSVRVQPGKNCSGIIRLGLKQKLTDGEIKSENIALRRLR